MTFCALKWAAQRYFARHAIPFSRALGHGACRNGKWDFASSGRWRRNLALATCITALAHRLGWMDGWMAFVTRWINVFDRGSPAGESGACAAVDHLDQESPSFRLMSLLGGSMHGALAASDIGWLAWAQLWAALAGIVGCEAWHGNFPRWMLRREASICEVTRWPCP